MTEPDPGGRPVDVDTGFWLWAAAVPLMTIGYLVDLIAPATRPPKLVLAMSVLVVVVVVAVVVTFLILMRHGYRWARTVLTAGGVPVVVFAVSSLFATERTPAAALAFAVAAIFGSVLIVGGAYLLHRKDATAYFIR